MQFSLQRCTYFCQQIGARMLFKLCPLCPKCIGYLINKEHGLAKCTVKLMYVDLGTICTTSLSEITLCWVG